MTKDLKAEAREKIEGMDIPPTQTFLLRWVESLITKARSQALKEASEVAREAIEKRISTAWLGNTAIGSPWSHLTVEGELGVVSEAISKAIKDLE